MFKKETMANAMMAEFMDSEIIELSLADLEYVSGGVAQTKCGASGTCDDSQAGPN